ncbi:MAG: GGDEF domain-containing protein [Erysipelotrichaceae bacterium]
MIKGISEKEINEQIRKLAVLDSLIPFRKATRFMGLINLGFAISWFLRDKSISDFKDFRYLVLYIYMFFISFACYFVLPYFKKKGENGYIKIYTSQKAYALTLMIWSVVVTIFDADHMANFSYLVYATAIVLIPSVGYFDTPLMNVMQIVCGGILMVATYFVLPGNYFINIANFIIFIYVAYSSFNMNRDTKYLNYQREVELRYMVGKDHLTGVYNRQKLNETADEMFEYCLLNRKNLGCIMFDIDYFKSINDTYGHLNGDKALKIIANIARIMCDENNANIFRYGGEEFLIIMSDCSEESVIDFVKEFMNRLSQAEIILNDVRVNITVSSGIYVNKPKENEKIGDYFNRADEALYNAKANGRNTYAVSR